MCEFLSRRDLGKTEEEDVCGERLSSVGTRSGSGRNEGSVNLTGGGVSHRMGDSLTGMGRQSPFDEGSTLQSPVDNC